MAGLQFSTKLSPLAAENSKLSLEKILNQSRASWSLTTTRARRRSLLKLFSAQTTTKKSAMNFWVLSYIMLLLLP